MSHAIIFDSLSYANQLKSVGVPEKQAEMQAMLEKNQIDIINKFIDDGIATKQDIKEFELKMELKMELIKKDLTIKLVSVLGSMIVICTGASTAILGFLMQMHH